MSDRREKAADEIYCRSCGEAIKKKAEICPHCGVRNEQSSSSPLQTSTARSSRGRARSQYQTTVSDTWWYGVAGGTALWVIIILLAGSGSDLGALGGFLVLVAWIGLPVAAYFDMQYVRANAEWDPETVLWVFVLAIWVVNVVAGGIYIYRRHEVLGVP